MGDGEVTHYRWEDMAKEELTPLIKRRLVTGERLMLAHPQRRRCLDLFMPADPANLRWFVDESALGLGKALAVARRDVVHAGHPLIPEVPLGALDTDWIPEVAARGLVAILRDKRIRTKPGEIALLRQHGLRVFWIAGKRDLATWDYLVRVVRRWDGMELALSTKGAGLGSRRSTRTASKTSRSTKRQSTAYA